MVALYMNNYTDLALHISPFMFSFIRNPPNILKVVPMLNYLSTIP
jgi:hypothetical protein